MVVALLTALVACTVLPPAAGAQERDGDASAAAKAALEQCIERGRSAAVDLPDAARRCLRQLDGFDAAIFDECWAAVARDRAVPASAVERCLAAAEESWRPATERPTTPRVTLPPSSTVPGGRSDGPTGTPPPPTLRRDDSGTVVVESDIGPDLRLVPDDESVNPWRIAGVVAPFAMAALGGLVLVVQRRRGRTRRDTGVAGEGQAPEEPPVGAGAPTARPADDAPGSMAARDRAHLVTALTLLRDRVPSEALRAEITQRLDELDTHRTGSPRLPGYPAPGTTSHRAQLVDALIRLHDVVPGDDLRAEITRHLSGAGVEPVVPASGERFDPSAHRGVQATDAPSPELDGTVATCDRPGWSDRGTELRPPEVVVNRWSEP